MTAEPAYNQPMQYKRTMMTLLVTTILACGSTVSSGQSVPEPKPTPDPDCYEIHDPADQTWQTLITVCPEPGPRNIKGNLRKKYKDHMAAKEERDDSRRSTQQDPTVTVDIRIEIEPDEHLAAIESFIRRQPTGRMQLYRDPDHPSKAAIAAFYVDIEIIPTIAAMDGVNEVAEIIKAQPQGSSPRLLNQSIPTARDTTGVER